VVINKIDRPDRRIQEVLNESTICSSTWTPPRSSWNFPVIYTNAKAGIALTDPEARGGT
jgi:GTP-binding protein